MREARAEDAAQFDKMQGKFLEVSELDEAQRAYYDYVCGPGDVVRMCNVPMPTLTVADLAEEKRMLAGLDARGKQEK